MANVEFARNELHPSQVVITALDISVVCAVMVVVVVAGVVVIGVVVDTVISVSVVLNDLQIGITTVAIYTGLCGDGLHLK